MTLIPLAQRLGMTGSLLGVDVGLLAMTLTTITTLMM
jgi:hypothetical protein